MFSSKLHLVDPQSRTIREVMRFIMYMGRQGWVSAVVLHTHGASVILNSGNVHQFDYLDAY